MNLEQRMRQDLVEAMRGRDQMTVKALRKMLGVIGNAEAVEVADPPSPYSRSTIGKGGDVPRRQLTDADRRQLVADEVAHLEATTVEWRRLGQTVRAVELEGEIAVLGRYLEPPAV